MADFGDASAAVAGNGVDSADKRPADVASPPSTTSAAAPLPARRTVKRSISTKKETMNGPLYMQASNKAVIVRRVKRKGDSPWRQLMRWFVENQIGFSFNLIALLFLAHGMTRARPYTGKYFTLSYFNPQTGEYALGRDDGYLILFCVLLFTGLRAASMEYLLAPFAKARGIEKRKDITRFSEQAWLLMYYSVFWTLGAYIYFTSPYYLNLTELWTQWPNREISGLMKGYMLAQLGFWVQQILVINIEERRKDHWQMFTHHIVTISLIFASYRYGLTRVGNLVLVLMDVVDIFLPAAKCLKYMGYTTICDVMFGVFMVSWLFARHLFYLMVCWSIYHHTPVLMPDSCYTGIGTNVVGPLKVPTDRGIMYMFEPLWNSEGLVCYDDTVRWTFLSMLLFLQALTIMWFCLIIRVAHRVITGVGSDDPRSDDEVDDLDDEDEIVYEEVAALEEEVGVDEIDLKSWERRTGVTRQASASTGVSLPGHSDRKELLGRIGCEKQVD